MLSNPSRSPQLDISQQFKERMKKGKVYEAKVQSEIREASPGAVFPNVRVGSICEFDVIVADYPTLSLVEIKYYRSNLDPNRVRVAVRKFRNHCKRATEDNSKWKRKWTPYIPQADPEFGTITNKELLFRKLSLHVSEGWKYRMVLVVPNKSFDIVLNSLNESQLHYQKADHNLLLIAGIPLLVIPEKRIGEVFG